MFPFFSLSLLLQRKIGKETALRDRPCEGGSLRILLGIGHFCTRRQKCFVPTEYIITTRLPNGGSFDFVLVPASQPHRLLLSEAVKQVAPTKRSVHRGDLAGCDSHRITAIRKPIRRRDTLAHHKKLVFVQSARGTGEAQKATPVRALALARGWR